MTGTWKQIQNQPSFSVDTMLLLTDGSVLCHQELSSNWFRLTPNPIRSDYTTGTWTQVASLPANAPVGQNGPQNQPLYYASAVLKDGRVFSAGGEYNGILNGQADNCDLLAAQIFDPVANTWTSLPTPAGWTNIGDAPTCVLPDGRVMMGNINSTATAILDPVAGTWSAGPNKNDSSSEETWTLLPDASILVAEVDNHPNAERYVPASNSWVPTASVPAGHDLVINTVSIEIGPAILMPNGRVFAAGASGHTAIYDTVEQGWAAGPDFPKDSGGNPKRAFDAPAALLPNGKVLVCAGQVIPASVDPNNVGWAGEPAEFFEFDGTSLTPAPALSSMNGVPTYNCRMLLLPTGQVLVSTCTNQLVLYQPDGSPHDAWRPTITSFPGNVITGLQYTLKGTQLNGLSQAVCYGDDAQMATNYPIVTLQHEGSNVVHYCRTFNHSTMAVATGQTIVTTHFQLPGTIFGGVESGTADLTVIANGIPSKPVKVHVTSLRRFTPQVPLKEIFENDPKEIAEGDPKELEGDPVFGVEGDPAWLQAIRALVIENEVLGAEVQSLKAFIGAAERPELGAAATEAALGATEAARAARKGG